MDGRFIVSMCIVPLIDTERIAHLPERCVENLHSDADGGHRKLHVQFMDGQFIVSMCMSARLNEQPRLSFTTYRHDDGVDYLQLELHTQHHG
jgi:hypothetical protein